MNELMTKNADFKDIYNKSYRLAAAVFVVSNIMDENEEIRTKIKNLALKLVSMSVNIKDTNFSDSKKILADIYKTSLELMSMLDIASISGLISQMNGKILKEEFQSFILELEKFSVNSDGIRNDSVRNIFDEAATDGVLPNSDNLYPGAKEQTNKESQKTELKNSATASNGHKRKNLRKNMILEFIKGHNNVSIKDIVPKITGCSEKTVQRELTSLIKEGKIRKEGERRWSRYSAV